MSPWSLSEAIALRTYLAGNPAFLVELKRRSPKIKGATIEERAMTGSEAQGYQTCLEQITAMIQDQPVGDPAPGFIN